MLESDFLADSHAEGIYGAGPETDLADNLNSITERIVSRYWRHIKIYKEVCLTPHSGRMPMMRPRSY